MACPFMLRIANANVTFDLMNATNFVDENFALGIILYPMDSIWPNSKKNRFEMIQLGEL